MRTPSFVRAAIGAALLLAALPACKLNTAEAPLATQVQAPAIKLASSLGEVSTQTALAQGPMVLIFYRGHW